MNGGTVYSIEDGTLRPTGRLSIASIGDLPERLAAERDVRRIDLSAIDHIDTVGAWLVWRTARDRDAEIVGADDDARRLIDEVRRADEPTGVDAPRHPWLREFVEDIGRATALAIMSFGGLVAFFGQFVRAVVALVLNPRRIRWTAIVSRFDAVGVRALGIIGLMSFLIGIVIAQQGAVQLRQFGAEVFTVNLIGRLTLRELGVLMTAIMVAGRSGSSFAAQLGTMKLTEEIDAMRTIGVSPTEALVVPRVAATTLMMPLLGFYASIVAMIGGGLLCWISLDIPPATYVQRLREVVPLTDLWVGLIKAPVFGLIVGLAGCFQGMQVESDAEQVGLRTTSAVVQAIFMVIVLDAFFAIFFSEIGWI